ncbi:MAG: response regulator [Acidobacteriota bacterium]
MRRSIGEEIELVTRLAPGIPRIIGDEGQIEQVLLNLALNAHEAMPQGGTLTIETESLSIKEAAASQFVGLGAGGHVILRVGDTGVGIEPSIRSRIFEPFFTTKESTQKPGLGLSTVYGVVTQCKGQIRVESEPGRGSRFEIYLPSEEVGATKRSEQDLPTEGAPRFKERILLVEDETAVRNLLRRFLDSQGYHVTEAQNGEDAANLVHTSNGGFDLLLTDLVMPGMGGFELARRLERQWPNLRVIFMSGYSEEAVCDPEAKPLMNPANFLHKPFSTDLLARQLRAVLDPD